MLTLTHNRSHTAIKSAQSLQTQIQNTEESDRKVKIFQLRYGTRTPVMVTSAGCQLRCQISTPPGNSAMPSDNGEIPRSLRHVMITDRYGTGVNPALDPYSACAVQHMPITRLTRMLAEHGHI